MRERVLDATFPAVSASCLPPNLGLRPQAVKLRFASAKTPAFFLAPDRGLDEALAGTAALSLLIWGWAGLSNALMLRAIGLDLPGYAPFFLLVMQAVGVLIPTPGFVGPFQYAHVVALGVYGVPQAAALSLALLIHAGIFAAVLAPGFWYAAREHFGLRELSRATGREGAG